MPQMNAELKGLFIQIKRGLFLALHTTLPAPVEKTSTPVESPSTGV
ncbi:MAG: hypothetical protein SVZ03_07695 [Spirochaetota bacterium]|nr:hypothetical protein [Spirochaetota bacterium]